VGVLGSPLAGSLVLGYDGAVMRRDVRLAMVVFWTSVPLFAVYLAVAWSSSFINLGLPGALLNSVVVASSAYLTLRTVSALPAEEGERGGSGREHEPVILPK
jgi:hypothetical protein